MTAPFSQARIDLEAKAERLYAKFAGPDDLSSSVDREHAGGSAATGVVLRPDPTPIFETARVLAELVAIRDRAR